MVGVHLAFSLVLMSTVHKFHNNLCVDIHFSCKRLVYHIVSVFDMVSSSASNTLMFHRLILSHSSILLAILSTVKSCSSRCELWYSVHCHLAQYKMYIIGL